MLSGLNIANWKDLMPEGDDYVGPEETCEGCGKRATGFAKVGDERYCHGSFEPYPTCYMKASYGLVQRP